MQYFKHYSNMRNDIKIKRLINKYGIEGYGLYNLILESITEKITTESPIPELQETCDDIAEFYNSNSTKINEIVNFMINQGLFGLDEITHRIICNKLYKFLEQNQTRSKQIRNLIKAWKEKQPLLLPDVSDNQETDEGKSEEQNRTEQNRTEQEKKIDITSTEYFQLTEIFFNDLKSMINPPCYKKKKPNLESWSNHIRLLHEQDGIEYKDMRSIWQWAFSIPFWQGNLLSTEKFRKHYNKLSIDFKNKKKQNPEIKSTCKNSKELSKEMGF